MKKIDYALILAFLLICASIILCFSGCRVSKEKRSTTTDSTHVQKLDTGRLIQQLNLRKIDSIFTREIIYFGKDTITNNYYTQPALIYRESGSKSALDLNKNKDSTWHQAADSTRTVTRIIEKTKVEQALSFGQMLTLIIGVIVLMKIIPNINLKKIL